MFRNPDLRGSLRPDHAITAATASTRAATAEAIVAIPRKEFGGAMTAEDLAEFEPEWVTPISTDLSRLDGL